MSAYQDAIEALLASGDLAVRPEPFRDEVLAFVRRGLQDISVSRSTSRARGWCIGVPDDPTQVIYVWFDALTNYISALAFGESDSVAYRTWWINADRRVHVIGKGILRFHAVYWPAFLASAGEPLPTRIQVHPYLTVGGNKLSKSKGTRVDPTQVVAAFGTDTLRWWFAREVASTVDTDYTTERLAARANDDLANGLGNVTNRIVTLVHRHRGGVVPSIRTELPDYVRDLGEAVRNSLTEFDTRAATRKITEAVTALNRDLEITKPWEVAKLASASDPQHLDVLLARYMRNARIIAHATEAIVPELSARLQKQLGRTAQLPPTEPAFAKIDQPDHR